MGLDEGVGEKARRESGCAPPVGQPLRRGEQRGNGGGVKFCDEPVEKKTRKEPGCAIPGKLATRQGEDNWNSVSLKVVTEVLGKDVYEPWT